MTRLPIAAALAGALIGGPALAGVAHDAPIGFGYTDLPPYRPAVQSCAPWQGAPADACPKARRARAAPDRPNLRHARPADAATGSN